jgi:hypothetical protein
MRHNRVESIDILEVWGIPVEWFYEAERKCDAWLKKHNAKPLIPIREQISNERRLRQAKKIFYGKH